MLEAGYELAEIREWSQTKRMVVSNSLLKNRQEQAEMIAKALGGKG